MIESNIFVPDGESRQDTAVLLVGTARDYDIPQRSIKATVGGFYITEALADVIYEDAPGEPEEAEEPPLPEAEPKKATKKSTTKKTSGSRAAKNDQDNTEEE